MKLAANQLAYGYPKRVIGRGIDLSAAAGEVMCVLGPNGTGKTTLFRTLLGLLPECGGEIRLGDRSLRAWPRAELAKVLAYVPQAHAPYFPFSVREIVLMGRTAYIGALSSPSRRDRDAAEKAMSLLGIAHLADQVYTQISGGERQLTLIARALAQEPQLLIMDEPTASLDFGNQLRVLHHIVELARHGIGVIFSSHDPDQALQHADSALLLRDGEILAYGPPPEVITADNLRRLYNVEIDVVALPGRTRNYLTCVPHSPNR